VWKSSYWIGSYGSYSKGFKLIERAPGVTVEHIISTEATLIIEGDIPEMIID
jgi:3-oxoacid CoA-transferase subunit B